MANNVTCCDDEKSAAELGGLGSCFSRRGLLEIVGMQS
jgi:hypothetical protein